MSKEVQDALVEALEGDNGKGCSMNEYLAKCLASNEKEVLDESIFKRKRGRPKKDSSSWGLKDLPQDKYVRAALLQEKKEKARMQDRLNPGSTKEEKKKIELNADLREIGWDLEECSGKDSDFKEMEADLAVLRKEANIKRGYETFAPYVDFKMAANGFKELRDDSITYYERAKGYVEKKDFKRAEELIDFLKDKPKEIEKKFESVQEAYDRLCEALCSLADEDRRGKGMSSPDSLEVEKYGIGMMDGEDFAMYSKRMRTIGMGKEIPKTANGIEDMVAATERRWRSVAGLSQDEFDKVKDNWHKTIRTLLKKCMLASNLKIAGLNRTLPEGLDYGDGDIGYGILQPLSPYKSSRKMGMQYGEIIVQWKPQNTVATLAFSDSLVMGRNGLNYVCPCFITNPSPCCFSPERRDLVERLRNEPLLDIGLEELCDMAGTAYCELQFHGDSDMYNAEAIESIWFSSEYEACNLSIDSLVAIRDEDISLFVKDDPIEIAEGEIKHIDDEEDGEEEEQDNAIEV